MTTKNFQATLATLKRGDFPYGQLHDEDWETLANIMRAYRWSSEFTNKLKEIEKNFLVDQEKNSQSMVNFSHRDLFQENRFAPFLPIKPPNQP